MSKQKLKTEDQKIQEAQQLLAAAKLKREQEFHKELNYLCQKYGVIIETQMLIKAVN